ncbi:hypothetical protein PoMZ_12861 [Pyricularia oryzae]|uniref:Uncharacterized protein n=1 Tax=Pyricularia oryzae TaxID=318829 RepID=A0A4P7NTN5_PYROR|nr:hypothetical protein PoMZ_12861 [Pyricularia oryzae]
MPKKRTLIRFEPGQGCQVYRKRMAKTKCPENICGKLAETSVFLEKSALALLDTLGGIELLKSTNSANPEIATVIEGLEEKAKISREIFEKACGTWLEAWHAPKVNINGNKPIDDSLSEIMKTCLLLQLLPHSPEARLHSANLLLKSGGVTDSTFPPLVVNQLLQARQKAKEETKNDFYL